MKPALKTTALAILVSLGVAACGSSGKNESASASKPVNTQVDKAKDAAEKARLEAEKKAKEAAEKARLEAEKKAKEVAEKARLEAEEKAKEAEKARLEAEKKAKETADAKAKAEAEKARLEAEKKAQEAEKARLEAEKKAKEAEGYQYNDNLKNKDGKEWRLIDSSLYSSDAFVTDKVHISTSLSPVFNPVFDVNFNELSGNQLGKFTGSKQGSFLLKHLPSDKLDYTFVNQPYSTYGVLADTHGNVETYRVIQSAFASPFTALSVPHGDDKNEYIIEPKGSATYKGDVLAILDMSNQFYDGSHKLVKDDGTFSVTADFDKLTVSGSINSDTLGKINLMQGNVNTLFKYEASGNAFLENGSKSEYNINFGGKELNDVVGDVYFSNMYRDLSNGKILQSYQAIFGGTKQK